MQHRYALLRVEPLEQGVRVDGELLAVSFRGLRPGPVARLHNGVGKIVEEAGHRHDETMPGVTDNKRGSAWICSAWPARPQSSPAAAAGSA
jgi:hypothetical protein